jgi:hypothetical protein
MIAGLNETDHHITIVPISHIIGNGIYTDIIKLTQMNGLTNAVTQSAQSTLPDKET